MAKTKPFTTVGAQLDILKSRGVYIADYEDARRFLLQYGSYQVVNAYKLPFLDSEKCNTSCDFYKSETTFDHLKLMFLFDDALRSLTLPPLLAAERTMRTAVIYAFCSKYQNIEDYLDPACYCSRKDYAPRETDYLKNLIRLLSTLQKLNENSCKKSQANERCLSYACAF